MEDTSHFGGYTMKNQTYVEQLSPVGGSKQEFPLIFVHGGGQSGLVRCKLTFKIWIWMLTMSCGRIGYTPQTAEKDGHRTS